MIESRPITVPGEVTVLQPICAPITKQCAELPQASIDGRAVWQPDCYRAGQDLEICEPDSAARLTSLPRIESPT